MSHKNPLTGQRRLTAVISFGLIVAGLYFAKEFLLPFAFAIFLSFLLAPFATRLERWRIPRIPSVVIPVVLLLGLLVGFGWLVTDQLVQLSAELPKYADNIQTRLRSVATNFGSSFSEAGKVVEKINSDLDKSNEPSKSASGKDPLNGPSDDKPMPVRVVHSQTMLQSLGDVLASILGPLGLASIVAVLVLFILLEREDLRHRAILLTGRARLPITTKVIDEATGKVSRYLRMQFIINAIYGVAVGVLAFALGLPNPWFWAISGFGMRFIPYLGAWLTCGGMTLLALAIFPGWSEPIIAAGTLAALELVVNNVLEPWLYGASTGISAVGIIASAIFWTWLWGPIGLFLSTPIAVCLSVMGRYIPSMEFLAVLLSEEVPVPPESRYYQRLLAMDGDEARKLLAETTRQSGVTGLFDRILLPTLQQAEADYHLSDLEDHQRAYVHNALQDAAIDACQNRPNQDKSGDGPRMSLKAVCIPAHGVADQVAVRMVTEFMLSRGCEVRDVSETSLASEIVEALSQEPPDFVLISTLAAYSGSHARYVTKRIRQRLPGLEVLLAHWTPTNESSPEGYTLAVEGVTAIDSIASLNDWLRRREEKLVVDESPEVPAIVA